MADDDDSANDSVQEITKAAAAISTMITASAVDIFYYKENITTGLVTGLVMGISNYAANTFLGDALDLMGVDTSNELVIGGITLGAAISTALMFTVVNQFIYRTSPYRSMIRTFLYAFIISLSSGFVAQVLPESVLNSLDSE